MPNPDRTQAARDHLERSERVWNRWANHYGLSESDFAPMREAAIDRLDLAPGDDVLDVGCGPGVNFEVVREVVGSSGSILAVDYSPNMVERARKRVAEHGWDNVEVREADATTAALGEGFDAAVSTLALSVMPNVEAAVRNVHGSLAPGAGFAVFDLRSVPNGPFRIVNPILRPLLRWLANWNPDGDVLAALESLFDDVEVGETYAGGIAFSALARRAAE